MKARLAAFLIVLAVSLPCPATAKNANLVESLDTIFGKTEAELRQLFGEARTDPRFPARPGEKFLFYEISAGPGAHDYGDTLRVAVTLTKEVATSVSIWFWQPGRGSKDLLSSLGRSGRHTTAIGLNFLNDKTRNLGRPPNAPPTTTLVRGSSDEERWVLVKANLLRLDGMNDQQVCAIFGDGQRFNFGGSGIYSDFYRYFQITPCKRLLKSRFRRDFELELLFLAGTVAKVKVERCDHIYVDLR